MDSHLMFDARHAPRKPTATVVRPPSPPNALLPPPPVPAQFVQPSNPSPIPFLFTDTSRSSTPDDDRSPAATSSPVAKEVVFRAPPTRQPVPMREGVVPAADLVGPLLCQGTSTSRSNDVTDDSRSCGATSSSRDPRHSSSFTSTSSCQASTSPHAGDEAGAMQNEAPEEGHVRHHTRAPVYNKPIRQKRIVLSSLQPCRVDLPKVCTHVHLSLLCSNF